MTQISYRNLHFPPSIVQRAVCMYVRFNLSLRDVEELLAEHGIEVSYETIRTGSLFIQPGKPKQNAYVEPYNRTVRYDWLNQYLLARCRKPQRPLKRGILPRHHTILLLIRLTPTIHFRTGFRL